MTSSNDRLDRIEAILERIASKEEEIDNRIDSNARTIQLMLEQQATERLSNEEQIQAIDNRIDSNARTIQAMLEQQATERLRHEEQIAELKRVSIQLANTTNGIANLLASLDEDRPTVLRRLNSIENKLDRLLEKDSQ